MEGGFDKDAEHVADDDDVEDGGALPVVGFVERPMIRDGGRRLIV